MIDAVIFDLDGLLADTERLHIEAYRQVFATFGMTIDERVYAEHWIRDGKGIGEYIAEHRLPLDPDDFRSRKAERYHHLVKTTAEPMPGAVELVEQLCGITKLALASSSYRRDVYCVLESLGLVEVFAVIAAKEDAKRLKPAPDVFLFVAEKLGVEPECCLVIEDAEKGIRAAAAAGMKSIVVPNRFTRDNDFSQATRVVSSLTDITPTLLESLA